MDPLGNLHAIPSGSSMPFELYHPRLSEAEPQTLITPQALGCITDVLAGFLIAT